VATKMGEKQKEMAEMQRANQMKMMEFQMKKQLSMQMASTRERLNWQLGTFGFRFPFSSISSFQGKE